MCACARARVCIHIQHVCVCVCVCVEHTCQRGRQRPHNAQGVHQKRVLLYFFDFFFYSPANEGGNGLTMHRVCIKKGFYCIFLIFFFTHLPTRAATASQCTGCAAKRAAAAIAPSSFVGARAHELQLSRTAISHLCQRNVCVYVCVCACVCVRICL